MLSSPLMAKSKHKGREKPERKGSDEPIPRGTARITLSKAHFFLKQADHSLKHRRDIEAYECYVEAGLVFARTILFHLQREYAGRLKGETKLDFQNWIEQRQSHPVIQYLMNTRDIFVHAHPMRLSQENVFYLAGAASPEVTKAHEMLSNQLEEIEAIIKECENRFK